MVSNLKEFKMNINSKKILEDSSFHLRNFIPYFVISLGISFLFFLSYLPYKNINSVQSLIISLSYATSISLFIYLAYFILELIYNQKKIQSFSFKTEVITTEVGLLIGIICAQLVQAKAFDASIKWARVPSVFLSGSFIGIGILYYYRYKTSVKENEELILINEKLQKKEEVQYINQINSKIGNENKIINLKDVHYFISKDHYTFAVTEKGEYIVSPSLKLLMPQLDPNTFFQVRRSVIINLTFVDSLKSEGQLVIKTKTGENINVSRSQTKKLKEVLLNR